MANLIDLGSLCLFSMMLASGQLPFKKLGVAILGQPVLDGFWLVARMPSFYPALSGASGKLVVITGSDRC